MPELPREGSRRSAEARVEEAEGLAEAIGVDVVEARPLRVRTIRPATLLGKGQVEEIAVAWVRFPSLDIVRARQSYERLSGRTYRYRSLGSGFTAEIDVDEIGLTVRYEGIWERVAGTSACSVP